MISDEKVRVARVLSDVDDKIAACRAWGHEWPSRKLRPGRPLPKGWRPRLTRDGSVEVTETCLSGCGKKRWYYLLPGGVYDLEVVRRYTDPPEWKTIHRDQNVGRREFQGEVIRRSNEDIMAAAKRNALADEIDGEGGEPG
jgi:hypothetical protein